MPNENTILAVLQSEIGLAGLTLVFIGFLVTKSSQIPPRFAKFARAMTIVSGASFVADLVVAVLSALALGGTHYRGQHLMCFLIVSLALTAAVGIVGIIAAW